MTKPAWRNLAGHFALLFRLILLRGKKKKKKNSFSSSKFSGHKKRLRTLPRILSLASANRRTPDKGEWRKHKQKHKQTSCLHHPPKRRRWFQSPAEEPRYLCPLSCYWSVSRIYHFSLKIFHQSINQSIQSSTMMATLNSPTAVFADVGSLKKSMKLDFGAGKSLKKVTASNSTPGNGGVTNGGILASPDLAMLKMASPELEKMIMAQQQQQQQNSSGVSLGRHEAFFVSLYLHFSKFW